LARNLPVSTISERLILAIRNVLGSSEFINQHKNAAQDFIRNRTLTFPRLFLLLANFNNGSYQAELDNFFKVLNSWDVAIRTVTAGALSTARKKLKFTAFTALNELLLSMFYEHGSPQRWKGFRVLAGDGSTVKIPKVPALAAHFGVWGASKGEPCPMARVSAVFDVLNSVYVHALIRPKAQGERRLLAEHLAVLGSGDLLLLDRGYPAYWIFARILGQGAEFCARISAARWQVVKAFSETGLLDQIITLKPGRRDRGALCQPLRLRLLRIDIGTEEPEFLITSLLDQEQFPYEEFQELYHKRWGVEEAYKILKARIEIEAFTGKSVESIYQDFHAALFAANLTSVLAAPTTEVIEQKCQGRKYHYQLNHSQALGKMRNTIILLFTRLDISEILAQLIDLFVKTIEAVRPGRMYQRIKKVKVPKYFMAYKRFA